LEIALLPFAEMEAHAQEFLLAVCSQVELDAANSKMQSAVEMGFNVVPWVKHVMEELVYLPALQTVSYLIWQQPL